MAGSYEMGERQYAPAMALRAVGRELVAVLVQASEGAEVDHRPSGARSEAQFASRTTQLSVSGFLTYGTSQVRVRSRLAA